MFRAFSRFISRLFKKKSQYKNRPRSDSNASHLEDKRKIYFVTAITQIGIGLVGTIFSNYILKAISHDLFVFNFWFVLLLLVVLLSSKWITMAKSTFIIVIILFLYTPAGMLIVKSSPHFWLVTLFFIQSLISTIVSSVAVSTTYGVFALFILPKFHFSHFCSMTKYQHMNDLCLESSKSYSLFIYAFLMHFLVTLAGLIRDSKVKEKMVQLKHQLHDSNKELKLVNKKLEEALKVQEKFLLSFSHEIRNPLNVVTANILFISGDPEQNYDYYFIRSKIGWIRL